MIDIQQQKKPVVWTIAASDCSAGTGIQADLMTFQDFGVYGCSVITALNAQTTFALGSCTPTERKTVVAQINALDSDLPAAAIKLGALPNAEIVDTVLKYLDDFRGFVVYDLELEASGEQLLIADGAIRRGELLPRIDLLVVNVEEAQVLAGQGIDNPAAMVQAAEALLAMGARRVLVTGAHFANTLGQRYDYWAEPEKSKWITIEELATVNNRGGGSTLSAAITAAVARGFEVEEAIVLAKAYVTQGIRGSQPLGSGPGAVAHLGWPDNGADRPQLSTEYPVF